MSRWGLFCGVLGWLLLQPLAAHAAKLSFAGRVQLITGQVPIEDARVTVTFHGHEIGIHEYTTQRTVRARTDESGNFIAEVKVPDRRYVWTHATVEIAETNVSKTIQVRSLCQSDATGGCSARKNLQVNPLNE